MAHPHEGAGKSSSRFLLRVEGIHGSLRTAPFQNGKARRMRQGGPFQRAEAKLTGSFVLCQSIGNLTIKACWRAGFDRSRRKQEERMTVRCFIEPVSQRPSACEGFGSIIGSL